MERENLHFLILSSFPLHFLILSQPKAAAGCATLRKAMVGASFGGRTKFQRTKCQPDKMPTEWLKKWLNRFFTTMPCAIYPNGIKTPLYLHLLLIAMERHQVATDPSQLSWTSILRSSRVSEVTEPLGIIRNRRRSLQIHQTSLDRL